VVEAPKFVPVTVMIVPTGPIEGEIDKELETQLPVPCIVNVKGFSSPSLFAIVTIADLTPEARGENVISKIENVERAMVLEGEILTVKSPGFKPPMVIPVSVKSAVPSLLILYDFDCEAPIN
jgi:hypothetical protein